MQRCISCGIKLTESNFVKFPCPICGYEIYRCAKCRKISNPYRCPECGFNGP